MAVSVARIATVADDAILDAHGVTGVIRLTFGSLVTTDPPVVLPEARPSVRPPGGPVTRSHTVAGPDGVFVGVRVDVGGGAWHGTALRAALEADLGRAERRITAAGVVCHRLPTEHLRQLSRKTVLRLAAAATRERGARVADVPIGHDRTGRIMAIRVPPWPPSAVRVIVAGEPRVARMLAARAARVGVPLRLSVLDPATWPGIGPPAGLPTADVVVCARLPEPAAAAIAEALGLSVTATSWLGRIGDGMAAVISGGMVRWASVWRPAVADGGEP